jgi:hypothetical protein
VDAVFFYVPSPTLPEMGASYLEYITATLKVNRKYFERVLMYSLEGVSLPSDLAIDSVITLPSRYRHYPHFMRVLSWEHYFRSEFFTRDSVLLDADVVLNRPLEEVFDRSFSVAFSAMPGSRRHVPNYSCVSGGVIFAKKTGQDAAVRHSSALTRIAEDLRLVKDPRFPQFKSAGVWGLDEMALNAYLENATKLNDRSLREVSESIGFDGFVDLGEGISLFGRKFNADYRSLAESEWDKPSVLHFGGYPKTKLFEYCNQIASSS